MGGGERLTGRSDPLGRRLEYTDNPRTTAVDRATFYSIRQGGPTRSSADVSVPRPRTHDDRTAGFSPDHFFFFFLITLSRQEPLPMFRCP